jgi:hypothetical protein
MPTRQIHAQKVVASRVKITRDAHLVATKCRSISIKVQIMREGLECEWARHPRQPFRIEMRCHKDEY